MMKVLWWYALAAGVVALDQYTKGLAELMLDYGRAVEILPVLNFTLQYNPGAAFSFLSDAGGWQRYFFSGVAILISGVLVIWIYQLERGQRLLALSLALILGGALGNLWDRLVLGHVVDFISVHYASSYFPAFNVADSAIFVGAVLMIYDSLFGSSAQRAREQA